MRKLFCTLVILFAILLNVDAKKKYQNKSKYSFKDPETSLNKAIVRYPITMNCLKDSDKDGIADIYDDCPSTKGTMQRNGCPDFDYYKLITFASHRVFIADKDFHTFIAAVKDIEFLNNKITHESEQSLLCFIEYCKKQKYNVLISSYADLGKDHDNNLVSKYRAEELKRLFIKYKVPPKSIRTTYHGDTMPVVDLPPVRFEIELNVEVINKTKKKKRRNK